MDQIFSVFSGPAVKRCSGLGRFSDRKSMLALFSTVCACACEPLLLDSCLEISDVLDVVEYENARVFCLSMPFRSRSKELDEALDWSIKSRRSSSISLMLAIVDEE